MAQKHGSRLFVLANNLGDRLRCVDDSLRHTGRSEHRACQNPSQCHRRTRRREQQCPRSHVDALGILEDVQIG
jgi:hypothetical protein